MSFTKRIDKVIQTMEANKAFLCLCDEISIFYLTGLTVEQAFLWIGNETAHLFVDGRFLEYAKRNGTVDTSLLSKEEIQGFLISQQATNSTMHWLDENSPYSIFQKIGNWLSEKALGHVKASENPVTLQRMVKDQNEIAAIKRACNLTWTCFEEICSFIEEGTPEEVAANELEIILRRHGAKGSSFDPIIAYTENAAYPHHLPSKRTSKADELVLIDMGLVLDHYRSDMTRVVFYGKTNPSLQKIYDVVRKAHAKALSICKPGTLLGELDKAARQVIEQEGYGDYFTHSLGHGIGLQTHENPRLKYKGPHSDLVIRPGMVFTIEPGIYIPELGGVRYEDIVVVTSDSYENLYSR